MESTKKLDEVVGVAMLAAAALTALSLLSYSSGDASWNVSTAAAGADNLIGTAGAWASDLLYQAVGLPALLLPLPLALVGYRRLRGRGWGEHPWLKSAFAIFFLAAASTSLSLLSTVLPPPSAFSLGGVLGESISGQMLTYLNRAGSLVVLSAAMLMALLYTTRFSIDQSLHKISGRKSSLFRLAPSARRTRRKKASAEPQEWAESPEAAGIEEAGSEFASLRPGRADSNARDPVDETAAAPWEDEAESEGKQDPALPEVTLEAEFAARLEGRLNQPENAALSLAPELMEANNDILMPPLDFLQLPSQAAEIDRDRLFHKSEQLTRKYGEFDVRGKVQQIHPGPVVTTFEFKPDPGVKYSKVTSLEQDLCLGLEAESVRIDRIPGKNTVGVEVPNDQRQTIYLREIFASEAFSDAQHPLTLALGKRINGNTYLANLAKMPHLLIAGSTGSGKSVGLNGMICSVLYKAQPAQVRFIMVDPKRLELGLYADIPHLLTPIVTDPKLASNALSWAVSEMEQRYKLLARYGVRNIDQFNQLMLEKEELQQADGEECTPLPYIVVVVDELADLMMTAGKEVETSLTRLAQMARAIGIHLILATQRPSVDVITGLIKANFPCRMAFRVSSRIDSRTILDGNGAEQLLGMGDNLFLPPGTSRLVRLHSPFVSEKEIAKICDFLRDQALPQYREEILESDDGEEGALTGAAELHDDLFEEAARFVVETRKASTSLLQRRFRIGYGRAARLLDMMEHEGLISPPDGSKARDVVVPVNYFEEVENPE